MNERTFDDRIANWVRVARYRRWLSAYTAPCRSIECRYRPVKDEVAALEEDDRVEADKRIRERWTPDVADAWVLEDVWRFLPDPHRTVIVLNYHRNVRPGSITARVGARRDAFEQVLRAARFILRNRLYTLGHI